MLPDAGPQVGRGARRLPVGALGLALLLVLVGVTPLAWNRGYYFRGDTEIAYVGWWYHLGERVRGGSIPLMEPLAWEAGNYVAEGQWGLFSPLTILIGLAATVVPDLVVFVTVLKIGLLVLGGLGTYLVVRSYRAKEPYAVVAGLVVGLSGQSVFLEWPSWVNGQIAAVLLPWAWWTTRRAMSGRSPAGALALCYLVTAVGYVYSVMYLAVILIACLVDAVLSRSRRQVLTVLGLSAFSGLVAVAVYLPGVLTAPVTMRDSWAVVGRGRGTIDLHQLFASMLPTLNRQYLLWLLPAVLWLDLERLRRSSRDLAGALVATMVLLLGVLGPSAFGPLRWPLRMAPALMVPLVVLLAVVASRSLRRRVPPSRLLLSIGWVCVAAYVVVARGPGLGKEAAAGVALVVIALVTTAWSLGHRDARTTTGVVLGWTVVVFLVQFALHPVPPAADRHMPAAPERYAGRLAPAQGDVMVLGDAGNHVRGEPAIADELLVGSSWHLADKQVQNGYSTIRFRRFTERFCRLVNGGTCRRALSALRSTEPTTGRPWADLLSVSTVVVHRPSFPGTDVLSVPDGWRVAEVTRYTVVWTRSRPLPTAGGVVATSGGVVVEDERVSDRSATLTVTQVGPDGGTVTFSRLAWPGYSVEGGELMEPVSGTLVRVAVPSDAAGSTVSLHWEPPGWALERAALSTAVLGGLMWTFLAWLGPRRRHRRRTWGS